jgi:tetratricopeptide (TPR) repeat protein
MGGVGKTQLATEYAYWHLGGYEAIWWVRSEEPARLASDYAGLGIALGVTSAQEPSQEVQISATRSWLEQQAGWLVVFDNVEKPDDLNDYLPRGGGGHVLITSRHQSWGGIAAQVSVEEWHRPESIAFLLKRTGREDREGANGVAEALGDLPLALAQAGAYMEEAHLPFVDYVHLLEINQKELLSKGTAFTGYELTVATAWSASFEKLETANPAAADLLRLCAFFAPDDIPLDVISKGAQYLPGPLAKAMSDQMNRAECVAALGRYSLAEVTGDALSVHRLVQAVMRDRLPDDPSKTWVEAAVGLINQAFPSQVERNPSAWPVCWRLLPHALASAGQAEALQLAPQATARLLNQTAGYLRERAQFAEAKVALERALGISEAAYGPDHPAVATAVNNLGNVLWDLGDLAGARAACERALRIHEAAYGPDHPEVAIDVNNLGNVLQGLGDLAGARAAFERALRIDEAVYGPDHPAVATDVNNLGNVLQGLGELAGARAAFERALEILRRFLGDDHPKTVIVRKNLESLDK